LLDEHEGSEDVLTLLVLNLVVEHILYFTDDDTNCYFIFSFNCRTRFALIPEEDLLRLDVHRLMKAVIPGGLSKI